MGAMHDMTLVAITSAGRGEIWLTISQTRAHVVIVGGNAARAAISLVLDETDMPAGELVWAKRLVREGEVADARQVARATDILLTVLLMLASPAVLCWQASRPHVRAMLRMADRGQLPGELRILRGSAREDNPYPPLAYTDEATGRTYADDHIVAMRSGAAA